MFLVLNCLLAVICSKLAAASVQESFLMHQLLPYFEDYNSEVDDMTQNRKNAEESDKSTVDFSDKIDAMQSSRDRRRADHYWTRKRGQESTTRNWYNSYYPYQYGQQNQVGFPTSFYYLRGKRAANDEGKPLKSVDEKELATGEKVEDLRRRGNPDQDRRRGQPFGMGGDFKKSM